jgi:hypothetical protein
VRPVFKVMLTWALSPLGTLLNAGLLAVVMIVLVGADPSRPAVWVPLAIYLGFSGFLDVSAYLTQRRKGLTSSEITEAVFERLWPSRESGGSE